MDVFLATDNAETQARFLQSPAHGHRIKTTTRIVADTSKLRQTSIADAAVDIFTCAAAGGPFKGCYTSSFSDAILRLRQVSGRPAPLMSSPLYVCSLNSLRESRALP